VWCPSSVDSPAARDCVVVVVVDVVVREEEEEDSLSLY